MTTFEETLRRGLREHAETTATDPAALEHILTRVATPPRRRRTALRVLVPAAGLAAAAAVAITQLGGSGGTAWAAAALRVAEAAPRLLFADSAWRVVRADEFDVSFGEMTFSNGSRELELFWQAPAEDVDAKRGSESERLGTLDVLGHEALLLRYRGSNEYEAFWRDGERLVELRGRATSPDEFRAFLAGLEQVDVDTWLEAMPESVVLPVDRAAGVREMLAGLPVPPGLDVDALAAGNTVRDRYQLGALVAGSVACGWIGEWVDAVAAGDAGRRDAAVAALASSSDWPILREMDADGDFPEVVWQYADAVASDGTVVGGKESSVEASYRAALGCG